MQRKFKSFLLLGEKGRNDETRRGITRRRSAEIWREESRRVDTLKEERRGDETRTGTESPYADTTGYDASGHPPSSDPYQARSPEVPQREKSDAQHSSRKTGLVNDGSPAPSVIRPTDRQSLPSILEDERMRTESWTEGDIIPAVVEDSSWTSSWQDTTPRGKKARISGEGYAFAQDFEAVLQAAKAECENLRMLNGECAQRIKNLEHEILALKRESKEENHRFEAELSALRAASDDKTKTILEMHKFEKAAMQDDMMRMREEFRGEVRGMDRVHKEVMQRETQDMKDYYEMRFKMMGSHHEEEKQGYEVRLRSMDSQHREEKQQMALRFDTEMDGLTSTTRLQKETYEIELANLRKQSEGDRQRMATEHKMEMASLGKRFEEEKAAMDWNVQVARDKFYTQLGDAQDKHNREMTRMARAIEEISREHEAEKGKMKQLYHEEKVAPETKQEGDNKNLKEGVVALKGALVKRHPPKTMSDHELAHRFQDLASEVDSFSRVRWENGLQPSWPFPERSFHNLENVRRTKQYVIQNTIWVILYEKIFCTPFQVLGAEGQSLEQEWVERHGQGQNPTGGLALWPTKSSEKWRCETVKKCLKAISQPLPESDLNRRVKRDYESSVKEAAEDISQELGRVAPVGSSDKQRMVELVRKAAKLWLRVGQENYRAFLLMSNSGARPSRSGQAFIGPNGAQEQVVVPELRRMGNAQGERLREDALVPDCKGKFSVFYIS
ncbi:MAG: hypothetical protein M1839_004131 [Geoglossum umbratile]|nr:MAG: hypothetical protein M1839_004131 [Geoglossum umbratile]